MEEGEFACEMVLLSPEGRGEACVTEHAEFCEERRRRPAGVGRWVPRPHSLHPPTPYVRYPVRYLTVHGMDAPTNGEFSFRPLARPSPPKKKL